MKKLSALIFIHFVTSAFAQQVVNTTTSNNIRITDKVSISMQPGFHVKAGSNTKFRAFIDTRGNGVPDYLEAHLPSHGENYIKTTECLDALCNKKKETVVYFDGLGREKQLLQIAASPTGKNIVTPFEYDGFGRQAKEFLPFPTQSTSSKISTETDGTSFYASLTGDTTPYSEKTYENSPLNRVLAQAAPGEAWKKGSGHEIGFDYQTNKHGEVLRFDVSLSDSYVPSLIPNGSYEANTLYKTITTDENGQPIQKFKDKEGRIVLKRIDIPGMLFNSSGNHDTYYVYDVYGNLTYVLPPKLIEVGNYKDNLAELGYQYQYDYKNRLVEKQLPGKGREYMVYDKQDRIVATQDALQRENGGFYTFMQYDKFDRLVVHGQHPEPGVARETLQNYVNGLGSNNVERTTSSYPNSGIDIFYTRNAYGGAQPTIVNYYDNYENLTTPLAIDNQQVIGVSDTRTKGLAVATFTNVLDTHSWNKSYRFYDKEYVRPIASRSENYLGGYATSATTLDFRGKIINSIIKHKLNDGAAPEITIKETFDYYDNELLKFQTHQVNNNPVEYITQNSYNEINQLISKKVGNDNASNPLQTIDYKYNIRGWMTDINNVDINNSSLFAFRLNYDKFYQYPDAPFVKNLYNGNISEVIWKTSSDNHKRSYSYAYDGLNRLLFGNYAKNNEIKHSYHEQIAGYDKNGNIKGIYRAGSNESSNPTFIDILSHRYQTNSNKLISVNDSSGVSEGFDDKNKNGNDYAYDVNGNLKQDLNKEIIDIKYNHLNLPKEVIWNASKKINYVYDASGIKLKKIVTNGSNVTTTDYLGGFQYKNNGLEFFSTTEGYVNVTNGTAFNYVYNYKDHLGNVRLSYQKENNGLKILEENNYYPFGLKHKGYNDPTLANNNYQYKYNGKELQTDLDINLYDYGARNYDPAIGRWMNLDPLAEKMRRHSPYNYAFNNPVFFIDPDGKAPKDWVRKGDTWTWVKDIKSKEQATAAGYDNYSDGITNNTYTTSRNTTITLGENNNFTESGNISGLSEESNSDSGIGEESIGVENTSEASTGGENSSSSLDKVVNSDEVKKLGITGSVISEGARNVEKAVEARKGVYLTDSKTVIEAGSLRQLNSSTYKGIKALGKGVSILGYATTAATIGNDFAKGNYYTGATRATVNGLIIGAGILCAPCGFVLSLGEATFGDNLYNSIEKNFDKK
ncbi:DUF6443 domain-containing protein [Chishuiella changwenlii]|uniref:DUF6443 domain-containing protein n=1 Tax=Chishuiella changwenlii TaxID=1434701 RepID=UPI002FD8E480